MRRVFLFLFFPAAGALGVLYALGFFTAADPNPAMVRIPKGASAAQIAQTLYDNGVVGSPSAFLFLAQAARSVHAFKSGTYLLERGRAWRALRKLRSGSTYRLKVTIPEGWTAHQIGARLQGEGIIADAEAFAALTAQAAYEGRLFPETYFLEPLSEPESIIEMMVGQFDKNYTPELEARAQAMGLTQNQALTLASIVEREARKGEERPVIASVYHNRLKKRMPLEADPTVQYALSGGREWKERLFYKDLDVASPYNTYRNRGLPPGPICNPGLKSIAAVLNPAETPYLYFVADGTGGHNFFTNYRDHINHQKESRRRKRAGANPQ